MFIDLVAKITALGIVIAEEILDCFVSVNPGICGGVYANLTSYGNDLVEWVNSLVLTLLQTAMANEEILNPVGFGGG